VFPQVGLVEESNSGNKEGGKITNQNTRGELVKEEGDKHPNRKTLGGKRREPGRIYQRT